MRDLKQYPNSDLFPSLYKKEDKEKIFLPVHATIFQLLKATILPALVLYPFVLGIDTRTSC